MAEAILEQSDSLIDRVKEAVLPLDREVKVVKKDGTTEDLRQEVKSELFKKWMPNVINWEEMQEVIENKLKVKASRKSVEDSLKPQEEDQYSGY